MKNVFHVTVLLATVTGALIFFVAQIQSPSIVTKNAVPHSQTANVNLPLASTTSPSATSTTAQKPTTTSAVSSKNPVNKPKNSASPASTSQALRAPDRYETKSESLESIEPSVRAALVNILCMPRGGGLRPVSGSGVVIDPRGVILTNAHVAQYVLLSESPQINLDCSIRAGSPAVFRWKAVVMYIPEVWISAHYTNINADRVSGTGEHDYALLMITSDMQGNPFSGTLPFLSPEARPNVAFQDDPVLVAGYPAEFVGGLVTQQNLYAVTSISKLEKLLTFESGSIDVFSVGGVIAAQGGSSGGAVVNAWRKLVGILVTTSEAPTTSERELHALNVSYINSDLVLQTGRSLQSFLESDVFQEAAAFTQSTAPTLIQKYISFLTR